MNLEKGNYICTKKYAIRENSCCPKCKHILMEGDFIEKNDTIRVFDKKELDDHDMRAYYGSFAYEYDHNRYGFNLISEEDLTSYFKLIKKW